MNPPTPSPGHQIAYAFPRFSLRDLARRVAGRRGVARDRAQRRSTEDRAALRRELAAFEREWLAVFLEFVIFILFVGKTTWWGTTLACLAMGTYLWLVICREMRLSRTSGRVR